MLPFKHHQRLNRVVPIVVLLFTLTAFLFLYQHTQEQRRQDDIQRAQQEQLELAQQKEQKELEKQRYLEWIDQQRTVHEPILNDTKKIDQFDRLIKTHDIAIPSPLPPWTGTILSKKKKIVLFLFSDSIKKNIIPFNFSTIPDADEQLLQMSLGASIRADLLTTHEIKVDFRQITSQQRVYKSLYQYFDTLLAAQTDVLSDEKYKASWDLFISLEKQLYPWIHPYWENVFAINSVKNNTTTASDRGIVMCVGDSQFHFAIRTIQAIRTILQCDLPIEIFAIDDDDLSPAKRATLTELFKDVSVYNIADRINEEGTDFVGWALKPFAALASSFQQVILMDADVYFFQSPTTLFDDPGYKATGTLFFYDRTLFGDWTVGRHWLDSFLPSTSSLVPHLRWWNYLSAHEQESGVVVIDKKRSLLGLLATCKMNAKRERQISYDHAHGDKETFWIGYEMVQTPYAFVKSHGGVLGGLGDGGDPSRVCGNILHLDAYQKPYWWNGGLLRDKNKWPDRYMKFTHYAQGEDWDFDTSCIKETDQIHEFNNKEKGIAKLFMKADEEMKEFDLID
ncbi:mannosyltransferase putative-domain-containing protein [Halteromyces radiatus]|uniref:mannosyltransferase putative-domain-containing protein n=1 Tax=Halteromyces radiatus TaxID=101107 RepID=UPI00222018B7|nr:mannosyltransferase putative-domain-containing protein [Halteromyces radiatus]KAI8079999.1 mannosyltransferase putative-domain-containing protein [Halteromyces radiatus]